MVLDAVNIQPAVEKLTREANFAVIHNHAKELFSNRAEVDTPLVSSIFEIRTLDGTKHKVKLILEVDSDSYCSIALHSETKPLATNTLQFSKKEIDSEEIFVADGDIDVDPVLQGSGIGQALFAFGNELVEYSRKVLQIESSYIIGVVIDRAKGAGQNREGWSTRQAKKIGYSNDQNDVKRVFDLLGWEFDEKEAEKVSIKIFPKKTT